MGAELELADATPLGVGAFALELGVAGKRDRVGKRLRPMGGELSVGGAAPFSFELAGGNGQRSIDDPLSPALSPRDGDRGPANGVDVKGEL